jgi:hypothetical protein
MKSAEIRSLFKANYDAFNDRTEFTIRYHVAPGELFHNWMSQYCSLCVFDKSSDLKFLVKSNLDEVDHESTVSPEILNFLLHSTDVPDTLSVKEMVQTYCVFSTGDPILAFFMKEIYSMAAERTCKFIRIIEKAYAEAESAT